MFLDALGTGTFVVTLPEVSAVEQVDLMVLLCGRLERLERSRLESL
jgi:hypothetical protein